MWSYNLRIYVKSKLFYLKKYLKITNKEFDEILYWYLFHIDIETSQLGRVDEDNNGDYNDE